MPFTFAHPAIIIPLEKKNPKLFNFTALILGSMAPDFEYFIKFKVEGIIGHTFLGFLYLNLPLVFVTAFLWHYVVKKPFISNLPSPLDSCFSYIADKKFKINSIKTFIFFVSSSLIGMGSHVLWDAFTHKNGFFVNLTPILSSYLSVFNTKIPIYKVLQHGSTLIGFSIIFMYIYLKTKENRNFINHACLRKKLLYWCSIFLLSTGITIYRIFYVLKSFCINYLGTYMVSFISALIISIVIISFIFKQRFFYKEIRDLFKL